MKYRNQQTLSARFRQANASLRNKSKIRYIHIFPIIVNIYGLIRLLLLISPLQLVIFIGREELDWTNPFSQLFCDEIITHSLTGFLSVRLKKRR